MKKMVMAIIGLLLLFAGCIPKAVTAPTILTPEASIGKPVIEKAAWEVGWEKLVHSAQKERKVFAYSTIGPAASRALSEDFNKKYGITLETMEGRGSELAAKILMEHRTQLFVGDIWLGGATTLITMLRPAGVLASLDPMFVLPELTDPELIKKTWWEGKLPFVDPEHSIFAHAAFVTGKITVNSDMVKPEEVKDWKDLRHPRWKNKIVLNDPTVPGTGLTGFAVFVETMGSDYMRELVKQEPVVVRDQRLQVEWIAKGKYPIGVSAVEDMIWEFLGVGAPLKLILPPKGLYITGGSGNLALLKTAPHPNAAKLFINYLLTREAQTIYSRAYGAQSGRNDVPTDHLEPLRLRQSGAEYFDSNALEFKLKMDDYRKLAVEIFGPLMK